MKETYKESEKKITTKQIAFHVLMFQVITFVYFVAAVLSVALVPSIVAKILLPIVFAVADFVTYLIIIKRVKDDLQNEFNRTKEICDWYESILDAVPFPIHVTDNNMKWTFINKNFEKKMVAGGSIKDRKSAYGLPCSTAGANICNTMNCGIRQLRERNKTETYFDWLGASCKQDTAAIKDAGGNITGYVEVVTDLTSILRVNDYSKNAIMQLNNCLESIANGDLTVSFEPAAADEYTDKARELYLQAGKSVKLVRDSLSTLVSETSKLAEAGQNGNLDVRGDESKLSGAYTDIIRGVNQTFDSIKAPLVVASEFISCLVDGRNQQDIPNIYKGYYASLAENLNKVRGSLRFLSDESGKLAQAGMNGDLSVRGDVGILKGGFALIIDGFNKTLDAIVTPLDEAHKVLSKMGENDFSVQMPSDNKGMLGELSESINGVRGRLLSIQDNFVKISVGDISSLDTWKKTGKRSENDKFIPAAIAMMQAIQDVIDESNSLSSAAYDGNLDIRGDTARFQGGYRHIIEGMNRTMEAVSAPIKESANVLQELAEGDLTVEMTGEYKGEYNQIKTSLNHAIASFNELLTEITIAAKQVSVGSQQVSDASQSLSQGASEQASSVEELNASITDVSTQTKQNATNATQANALATTAQKEAEQGNEKMGQMLESMREINESSTNISKIIKVIDDIAFQTNILALNAAVEAARAGQYGKGFAVVAEEVRNLAGKSSEAAKDTTALIEGSIGKVQAGTKIANETADTLVKISGSVEKAAALVGEIASASNQQATAIAQIDQGITQVSTVVQTNSATAEESAASSEELSGQAEMLQQMVGKFKLNAGSLTKDQRTGLLDNDFVDRKNAVRSMAASARTPLPGRAEKYR